MTSLEVKKHGRRQPSPTLDRFAELLSREVAPADAAEIMGYQRVYGRVLLGKLRKRLGPQAI